MVTGGKKNPFKGRQFTAEIILWAVRWYLQFPISYRDLEGDVTLTKYRC
jgi:transposase-like protein